MSVTRSGSFNAGPDSERFQHGGHALEFCRAHPDTEPGCLALVARPERLLARAAELEQQEKIEEWLRDRCCRPNRSYCGPG
jgi:hypothetical protein